MSDERRLSGEEESEEDGQDEGWGVGEASEAAQNKLIAINCRSGRSIGPETAIWLSV